MKPILQFLFVVSVGLSPFFTTGCGKGDAESSTPESIEQEPPNLVLLNWEGYISTNVLERFKEETGITVKVEEFGSNEQLEARMQEDLDTFDLAVVDDSVMSSYIPLRLLQKLDQSKLSNLDNIEMKLKGRAVDPNNEYSVPYFWGLTILVYNKRLVKEAPTSWLDLWKPKFEGQVGLMDDPWDYLALGVVKTTGEYTMGDASQWSDAEGAFAELLPLVGNLSEFDDILADVGEGRLLVGNCYNGDAFYLGEEYPDLQCVIPKEGGMTWVDSLVLSRKSKYPNNAHKFLDFLLIPEIAAINANEMSFPPVVKGAHDLLDPELRANPYIFPGEKVLDRFSTYPLMTPELRGMLDSVTAKANARRTELNLAGRKAAD